MEIVKGLNWKVKVGLVLLLISCTSTIGLLFCLLLSIFNDFAGILYLLSLLPIFVGFLLIGIGANKEDLLFLIRAYFIYILGFVSLGLYREINHLAGSDALLIYSVLNIIVVFSPLYVKSQFIKWKPFARKPIEIVFLSVLTYIAILFISLGILFKLMYWPGANILLIVSPILLIISFFSWNIKFKKEIFKRKAAEEKIEAQHAELEETHKEITDSIAYAKRIQSAILPPIKLVKEYLQESFVLYKPKDVVAGDFYWFYNQRSLSDSSNQAPRYNRHSSDHSVSDLKNSIETPFENTDEKTILFAAADCTGHGVPGAMVSVVCNSALNRAVKEFGLSEPGEILTKTRDLVIEEFEKSDEEVKDGMDIALCSLQKRSASRYDSDPNQNHSKSFVLKYAGAYNPLWIIRNGATEVEEIKAHKQAIGLVDNPEAFPTHEIQLNEGDAFYVFSDGYVDQFGGERGKKYKAPNFRKLLLSIQDKSMEEQQRIIDQTFEAWRGSLEQIDDVCVIGVRI